MATVPTWKYDRAVKARKYAWAKFYQTINDGHHTAVIQIVTIERQINELTQAGVPAHLLNEFKEMATSLHKEWDCPICMCTIPLEHLTITPCGHKFCTECLQAHITATKHDDHYNCPVCRRKTSCKDNE